MTVVELIQALVPFGDYANVRVTVIVDGQRLHYPHFIVKSDGIVGVEFVVQTGHEIKEVLHV
jgi:hypothetical protein